MYLKAFCKVLCINRKDLKNTVRIMKLTTIILLSVCLAASAGGFSQTITLHEEKVPIQKIFREIWKQSGYQFVYTDQILKGAKPVTINVREAALDKVLLL